jgi:DNA adenine methylase
MTRAAPHILPYQGSKRKLAAQILQYLPEPVGTLFEPFAGSAAITLAAASNRKAAKFVIADKLAPLAGLWQLVLERPEELIAKYAQIWHAQLVDSATHFLAMREAYNATKDPVVLLYLTARCVKNAVRFNAQGDFNQAADKRRLGMRPEVLAREVRLVSELLRGRTQVFAGDFRAAIAQATPQDLVYMDPPWQGTSGKKDPRYAFLLDLDELLSELHSLNDREVPIILSFDGVCGARTYGQDLPRSLGARKVLLNAGRSSQATLLGRNEETLEALYLSPALLKRLEKKGEEVPHRVRDLFEA